ncbi:MAG TPA: sulfite reductase flavoprotein subunit alpha, partial [Acidocella sp.]|nr:sulfite reductase flavoprotein subunit alpha [Acidocella sp.]
PEETGLLALENLPGPALAADERLYLRGFMQGVAMRPEGVPELPATAPVAPERRVFLNGVLAGMFARLTPAPTLAPATAPALTILYASQTGTAEAAARAAAARLAAVAKPLNDVAPCTLAGTVLFYTSSFGDGDPPDNGARFWRALMQEPAPALGAVRFGVLAFGDSAYAQFCGFGRKLEERLLALGAQKLLERAECEPGDEGMKDAWLARAEVVLGAPEASVKAVLRRPSGISRNAPYRARLVANKRLNMPGSEKDTRQLIFDLGNSGLVYEPGDALGVWPQSDPADLAAFMHLAGVDGDFADRDVTRLTPALLKFYAARAPSLAAHLAGLDEAGLRDFTWGRQLIDLLAAYQVQASADEWRAVLKPLAPRLYSISSSLKAHPGEVHLTINILRYQCGGRQSGGLGSRFLADRAEDAEIFVQPTSHFRLPEDDSVPVIMIGPGTGIAPFRGFLQERRMRGAKGRNWLIFGEQRAACDFYYCEELEGLAREGILQRLSTAFSRDQEHKIYVQDRLRAEGDILWAWLQEGAHLYVCGDAVRMARDVDAALRDIVAVHGGITGPAAGEFVDSLMAQGRYLRDVY